MSNNYLELVEENNRESDISVRRRSSSKTSKKPVIIFLGLFLTLAIGFGFISDLVFKDNKVDDYDKHTIGFMKFTLITTIVLYSIFLLIAIYCFVNEKKYRIISGCFSILFILIILKSSFLVRFIYKQNEEIPKIYIKFSLILNYLFLTFMIFLCLYSLKYE
jgi:hypothetical protein